MKANVIAVILIAALVVPASAGTVSVKAAGDNQNFRIFVDNIPVKIYPDGSSDVIPCGDKATITIESPGNNFSETITTKGSTIYQSYGGAQVTPTNPLTINGERVSLTDEQPKEKDNNKDGSKHPKGGKK